MKTARALLPLATLALVLGVMPGAGAASNVDCGADDGRDRLTTEGYSLTFDAPTATAPELAATHDVTGDLVTPYRSAQFEFTADFSPYAAASVKVNLDWENPSDYDIFVYDHEGAELARSDGSNIDGQTSMEELILDVNHCDRFVIAAKNWAGSPEESLKLAITVTPGTQLLACAEADTAPGCTGKQAGQAPDFVPDTRTRLYLGGDPGQIAMLHAYQNNGAPFRGTLAASRPTGGSPNSHTRALVGFHDQWQNPLVPHFTGTFTEPRAITGDVTTLLWASSPTLDATGKIFATLYGDGAVLKTVEIAGNRVTSNPTRLAITFPGIDALVESSLTLQVATAPVATSGGQTGNARDALVTLHYGSVQFPSRVTLP